MLKRCVEGSSIQYVLWLGLCRFGVSLLLCFMFAFMRFSASRCRPLYKASLENVEVAC
jgi:hypothetical protein